MTDPSTTSAGAATAPSASADAAPEPTIDRVLSDGLGLDGASIDVHVTSDGTIAAMRPAGSPRPGGVEVVELVGRLVLPALAEPHAHLDKALTAERVPNPSGDLHGAIEAWIAAAQRGEFHHDEMVARAERALELLLVSGVTAVRTHVNVGEGIGASHVRAVRTARERFAGLIDVQIVALTASPMIGTEGAGNRAALVEALEVGVDLVGGCPHLEPDGAGMIAGALRAATEAGLPIDLHVDETLDPSVLTLEELARQVDATGFGHPVTASHCVSLGMLSAQRQGLVSAAVASAGISVVTLPQTNLFLQGRDRPTATPRGLTAIRALRDAGVRVAAGADNVQDPFNLLGRSDPLETAALLVMAGHLLPEDALDLVSGAVREVMDLPTAGFEVGSRADLMAIGAPSVRAAVAAAPHDRLVFRSGRLVATSTEHRRVHHT